MHQLREDGSTVLLTTRYLEEARQRAFGRTARALRGTDPRLAEVFRAIGAESIF